MTKWFIYENRRNDKLRKILKWHNRLKNDLLEEGYIKVKNSFTKGSIEKGSDVRKLKWEKPSFVCRD